MTQHSASMYVASCFAIGVLGFTQVGQTNFNVSGSLRLASGISGSILTVSGTTTVTIPSSSYSVTVNDANRILALKSSTNPRFNSGLFRIETVDSGLNTVNIAYRTTDSSISETNSLVWTIFENEQKMGVVTDAASRVPNGSSGYQSTGASFAGPRIILQSPHSSSWQVRFCQESSTDYTNLGIRTSVAPGFSGSALGDFTTGSLDVSKPQAENLHGPAFFDTSSTFYIGSAVGFDASDSTAITNTQTRYYIWGDDETGTCIFILRNVTSYYDYWFSFGLPENDQPTSLISQKLFAFGRHRLIGLITNGDISWKTKGTSVIGNDANAGVAFGLHRQPEPCNLCPLVYVGSVTTLPYANTNASDNNLLSATELHDVDIYAGITDSPYRLSQFPVVSWAKYDPRKLGTFPMGRIGRTNFTNWTLTNDSNKSWFHTKNGVYLPWEGPSIL